jgi:DNA adenine methylase
LQYQGGKCREISHFLRHIPDDFDRYIEPFLGGGALFFHIEPARAVLNDVNARLMGFYCQLSRPKTTYNILIYYNK